MTIFKKHIDKVNNAGILLVEIILAIAVFSAITLIVLSAFIYGQQSTSIAGDNLRASEITNQTIEAVQSISQGSFNNLASYSNGTTYYLTTVAKQWSLTTTPTLINSIYSAKVVFSNGPSSSRQATVTVSWNESLQRSGNATATTYLANWTATSVSPYKTGLLVYANGGQTIQLIDYRLLQPSGQWTNPLPLPNLGSGTSNRVARSVKQYPAQTGNSKMVLARFFDGRNQFIYGFFWNGSSWSAPALLAQWVSSSYIDSGNFSGGFLVNGTFVAVYSDNTNIPKYNTFNGAAWSAQGGLPQISNDANDFPAYVIVGTRPGTNEALVGMLGFDSETVSSYFSNNTWSSYTLHANTVNGNGTKLIDFAWSPVDATKGALIYTHLGNDRTPTIRVFTANGLGSGSWGSAMVPASPPTSGHVLSVGIGAQAGTSTEFEVCDKDDSNPQNVFCYTATPTTVSSPINQLITNNTASGGQQSFDLAFEKVSGTTGLIAYSDNTSITKLKTFNSTSNTWDANPIATPTAASTIEKTRIVAEPGTNDAMVLAIDTQNNLYSTVLNGTSKTFYSTPTGYTWTIHNADGPSVGAKWFDFAWDN
jgi:hypothetical protein